MNEWLDKWVNVWMDKWMNVTKIFYCYDTNEKRKELFFQLEWKKNV